MRVILNGEHAIKSVFDGRNPLMVDEIAHAMKSCFAGLYLDGFDFIQGVSWISSERSEDFIVALQRFH